MCLQIEFVFADGLRQTVEAAEVPCRHPTRLPGPNNRCIHDSVRLRIEVDCPSPYGRDLPTTIRLPSQRLYEWEECEEKMVSAVTDVPDHAWVRIAQSQRFEDPNVVLDIGYYTADLIVARTTAMWRLEKGPPTRCWIE